MNMPPNKKPNGNGKHFSVFDEADKAMNGLKDAVSSKGTWQIALNGMTDEQAEAVSMIIATAYATAIRSALLEHGIAMYSNSFVETVQQFEIDHEGDRHTLKFNTNNMFSAVKHGIKEDTGLTDDAVDHMLEPLTDGTMPAYVMQEEAKRLKDYLMNQAERVYPGAPVLFNQKPADLFFLQIKDETEAKFCRALINFIAKAHGFEPNAVCAQAMHTPLGEHHDEARLPIPTILIEANAFRQLRNMEIGASPEIAPG